MISQKKSPGDVVVALSGATSYLGGRFVDRALSRGVRIIPIIRNEGGRGRLPPALSDAPAIHLNKFAEDEAILSQASIVINMATCYGRSNESIDQLYAVNVGLPLMLISAAARNGIYNFINIGTVLDKSVGLYAQTKHFGDELLSVLAQQSCRLILVKPDIFFGPGEKDSSKLPIRLIRELKAQVPSISLSPGEQRRYFLHVDDVADAVVSVLENISSFSYGQSVVGLGSDIPSTIREFALTAKAILQSKTVLEFGALPYRPGEPMTTDLDRSSVEKINWRPRYDLHQAITDVINRDGPDGYINLGR